MIVNPIKTNKITRDSGTIFNVLDTAITELGEESVVAITSKIVSICEGNVVPFDQTTKDELIRKHADRWLPAEQSKYGHHFSIIQNTLIASAGIDESNGEGYYILWPRDPQQTVNDIREYIVDKFQLERVGVIITDSTSQMLRRGASGIVMAHSGFAALENYIGKPDLFGRPFGVTQANIASGLAASAVLVMGEGTEQTPIAVISDVPFVKFQPRNPTAEELAETIIEPEDDLFAPFLMAVDWQRGEGK